MTKPGRTRSTRTPVPCSESASPRAKASRPALAAPYTKLALRGRTAATEDSTTMVPLALGAHPGGDGQQAW